MMTSEQLWKKMTAGVFVIAEAGKGFIQEQEEQPVGVYLERAKKLVDAAIESGADAIKWQTHEVEDEQLDIDVTSEHFKSQDRYSWVTWNTKVTPLETFWKPLYAYAEEKGIICFTAPMSRGAAQKVASISPPKVWKIGSGDILDFALLDYVRQFDVPIILSTGMSTMEEVQKAVEYVKEKNNKLIVLHCVSQYPCPPEDLRLGTIHTFQEQLGVPIGFSDHSIGIEPDIVAVAMGATVIEKHFSFSRDFWGSDHKVSMLPSEMREMVDAIAELRGSADYQAQVLGSDYAKKAMSQTKKVLQEGEEQFRPLFRKSLMVGQDITAGTTITADMVYAMRPQAFAGGLPSEEYPVVVGKTVSVDLKKYDPITLETLE